MGPNLVTSLVHQTLDLTKDCCGDISEGYVNFVRPINIQFTLASNGLDFQIIPPVAPRMKFYFFEVENHIDLISGNATGGKPQLRERGPYTYRELLSYPILSYLI